MLVNFCLGISLSSCVGGGIPLFSLPITQYMMHYRPIVGFIDYVSHSLMVHWSSTLQVSLGNR